VTIMLQMDMTMLIIWWVAPLLILVGRAALVAYRTKQKRDELRKVEEDSTPFTREL